MPVLTAPERARTAAQLMRDNPVETGATKADWRAAVGAADDWLESALVGTPATSYPAALPAGFRTNSTQNQKLWALTWVLLRRIGRLRAEGD